jgi:hypothetical protein
MGPINMKSKIPKKQQEGLKTTQTRKNLGVAQPKSNIKKGHKRVLANQTHRPKSKYNKTWAPLKRVFKIIKRSGPNMLPKSPPKPINIE